MENIKCRPLLKSLVEGTTSKALLNLLLTNSLSNYFWDAGMRIYENMGTPPSGKRLESSLFKSLPRLVFESWNFEGMPLATVITFVSGQSTLEMKTEMVNLLNFIIDFDLLKSLHTSINIQFSEFEFYLNNDNQLRYRGKMVKISMIKPIHFPQTQFYPNM